MVVDAQACITKSPAVVTDALVLKHQAINTHTTDQMHVTPIHEKWLLLK